MPGREKRQERKGVFLRSFPPGLSFLPCIIPYMKPQMWAYEEKGLKSGRTVFQRRFRKPSHPSRMKSDMT